jgi:hypothetical protein
MPNWCLNTLMIDTTTNGGKVLAEAFKPKYEDKNGQLYAKPFHDLMPIPSELEIESGFFGEGTEKQKEMDALYKANIEKYGYPNWYDWCNDKWGTKWDARVDEYDDGDPSEVYVYFDTAWCPPAEFFKWFADEYPDANFSNEYSEEGMQFAGVLGQKDGIFLDESWDTEQEDEDGQA